MFESWLETILLMYRRERFPLRVFAPVALVLTTAAYTQRLPDGVLELLLSGAASLMLLFQFRLWDDLADRDYDRVHHPDRRLPRSDRVWLFYLVVVVAGLSNAVLLLLLGGSLISYLVLNAATLLWYSAVSHRLRTSIAGRHILLLKYPAFVCLLSSEFLASMAIVYVCSSVYELLHDREIRLGRSL